MSRGTSTSDCILLVEDMLPLTTVYLQYLRAIGLPVIAVDTGTKCLAEFVKCPPKVLILDLGLPDSEGLGILTRIRAEHPETSVIVITGNASLGTAIEAMRMGAFDYVVKPLNAERLCTTVRNALARAAPKQEISPLKAGQLRDTFYGFYGASAPMQLVYRMIESAAPSQATVFITGESGTGKELCASAIHNASDRAKKTFVPINCAAIPHGLMESEIFGHVKGAFSGATSDRVGAAMEADGGTLFLDEICEMEFDLQAKLLRLIQTGSYQRVGSSKTEHANLRVVCATNRDPKTEVAEGRFREDLYYRLHVIPMQLPPLRDRGDDIMLIANRMLARFSKEENKEFMAFSAEAEEKITNYNWPGNIRELQNALRNAVVLNHGKIVEKTMLPTWIENNQPKFQLPVRPAASDNIAFKSNETFSNPRAQLLPLWQIERDAIMNALRICDGNVTRAAAYLEIGASTLYRKKIEFDAMISRSA
jgi:two-component system, repressor protein LuxO